MKFRYFISLIAVVIFFSMLFQNLMAFKNGIVGFTRKNGETIGCVCHGLEPNDSISVKIIGPATVRPNDTVTYVLNIANGPAITGGCNIATSLGKVITSPLDTTLKREEQFPGSGFELTHKDPKAFAGDTLKFRFRYIAPSTPNVIDTLFANGNSSNNDLGSDNDKWNYANNFLINVSPTSVQNNIAEASSFELRQNFPNPFNPSTMISFSLAKAAEVNLSVFDMSGKTVAQLHNGKYLNAGVYEAEFDAAKQGLNSGVYFYRLSVNGGSSVKKMVLVK